MQIAHAKSEPEWESFLKSQEWSPFLQSWVMGDIYEDLGCFGKKQQKADSRDKGKRVFRFKVEEEGKIVGICQAVVVPARRGRHLMVSYGPVLGAMSDKRLALRLLVEELKRIGQEKGCAFVRMSPFWGVSCLDTPSRVILSDFVRSEAEDEIVSKETRLGTRHDTLSMLGFRPAPLHMLAEHIWYINLKGKSEADILAGMRKNTRNLIRRAEKEGVTITKSQDPVKDLSHFLKLHEETRKRHHFIPYTDSFFRAQVEKFAERGECALYLAHYKGEVVASSIHMIYGGETSYHHGASTQKYPKCFASYLLQWRAIQDTLKRGDRIYNFWGIAPLQSSGNPKSPVRTGPSERPGRAGTGGQIPNPKHPFAGVTIFKKGFGGQLLELQHCMDLPLSPRYWVTFAIESMRRLSRGF